jgi:hypothetical protein
MWISADQHSVFWSCLSPFPDSQSESQRLICAHPRDQQFSSPPPPIVRIRRARRFGTTPAILWSQNVFVLIAARDLPLVISRRSSHLSELAQCDPDN